MTQVEFQSRRFCLTYLTVWEQTAFLRNPKIDQISPFVLLSGTDFYKRKNPFVHSTKNGEILV